MAFEGDNFTFDILAATETTVYVGEAYHDASPLVCWAARGRKELIERSDGLTKRFCDLVVFEVGDDERRISDAGKCTVPLTT